MLRKVLAMAFLCVAFSGVAFAQSTTPDQTNAGVVVNRSTVPAPAPITTGNTFQQILPSIIGTGGIRQSLTIQNNNTTDNCNLIVGGPWAAGDTTSTTRTINGNSLTGAKAAILLLPGGSYTRYWPFVPSDQILGTCATTGDSLYVDTQ